MLRLILSTLSFLCLLTVGLLLWQSHVFPDLLPHGTSGWLAAWFSMFKSPATTLIILAGAFLLALASASISEFILGIVVSFLTFTASILCLLGFLGSHYTSVAEHLEKLLR